MCGEREGKGATPTPHPSGPLELVVKLNMCVGGEGDREGLPLPLTHWGSVFHVPRIYHFRIKNFASRSCFEILHRKICCLPKTYS